MGESRTELIAWVNDLLQINYTKIEQCGTGGAYCQIIDSIFLDVPMGRVKMDAKQEYEYLANYKILQNVFKKHKIDKPIPVERLTKCKMQDNLEFMQWLKRYWDANFGGAGYDAVARRKGAPVDTPATMAPLATGRGAVSRGSGGKTPIGRAGSAQSNEAVMALQAQLREMSTHLEGLEKERDFYFAKLRDIEIMVGQHIETLEAEGKDEPLLRDIQKILYSTEEGFEVPEGGPDEEETF